MELSSSDLREILRVFADSDLRDLHIEVGDVKLRVSKDGVVSAPLSSPAPSPVPPASSPAPLRSDATPESTPLRASAAAPTAGGGPLAAGAGDVDRTGLIAVHSPAVGVFYRRPAPDQPPYVEVGTVVAPDTPVATIEVMKMFTEVVAGCSGTVVEICAESEHLVEHGQALLYVDPS